jgi:hypothetical protein
VWVSYRTSEGWRKTKLRRPINFLRWPQDSKKLILRSEVLATNFNFSKIQLNYMNSVIYNHLSDNSLPVQRNRYAHWKLLHSILSNSNSDEFFLSLNQLRGCLWQTFLCEILHRSTSHSWIREKPVWIQCQVYICNYLCDMNLHRFNDSGRIGEKQEFQCALKHVGHKIEGVFVGILYESFLSIFGFWHSFSKRIELI